MRHPKVFVLRPQPGCRNKSMRFLMSGELGHILERQTGTSPVPSPLGAMRYYTTDACTVDGQFFGGKRRVPTTLHHTVLSERSHQSCFFRRQTLCVSAVVIGSEFSKMPPFKRACHVSFDLTLPLYTARRERQVVS